MKKKIVIFSIIFFILITIVMFIYSWMSPMLKSGIIREKEGIIQTIHKTSIEIKTENGEIYNCKINNRTLFRNNYSPKTGDNVTIIYDYDEKLEEKNNVNMTKEITAKRIYINGV